jgi:hypothetical protein
MPVLMCCRVDAGMCRVLNNFGEIAVRVLERHVGLAQRLQAARMALPPQLARLQLAASTGLPDAAAGRQLVVHTHECRRRDVRCMH